MYKLAWFLFLLLSRWCLHYTQGGHLGQQKVSIRSRGLWWMIGFLFKKSLQVPHVHHVLTCCGKILWPFVSSNVSFYGEPMSIVALPELFSPWHHLFLQRTPLLPYAKCTPPLDLIPPPIFNYELKHIFFLDMILFTQALTATPHLFLGGLSGMVYEQISRCFIPKDPSLGFS
jgi:hypothetical protein